MKGICWLLTSLLFFGRTEAQNFGGFPPSTKWKQINTDTARIIFNVSSQQQAERIAAIIHKMAGQQPASLGARLKKINVVLHSNTTIANGYVGLGPFRSEYYLIPSSNIFDLGNLPWNEHLAVHEYRHVQQYNNFNKGLTKIFTVFAGQEGRALANALTIPAWFFEGDAVHAETSLTPQGRGRLPLFLSGYKSLWQEGKDYHLMKLLNGSLKDYVPNHYQLGYLLVNYGYEKYGTDFWRKITADAASFKGLIYPFRKAIKQHSGTNYRAFVKHALSENKKSIQKISYAGGKDHDTTVTNFYFPQAIGQDSLLYLKDSYKEIPAFYVKDKNGEHKIKLRNISGEEWISYHKGLIAYTAYSTDARWSLTDYSDIVLLNIRNKKEQKLTKKGKYFSPDFSPSGNRIVAVSVNERIETDLHLLNSKDGSIVKQIKGGKRFFIHPRFIDEANIITGIRMPDGTVSLNRLNLAAESIEVLTPPSFSVVGYPSVYRDTVYFTAAYNGNDDLYALSLRNKKLFRVTNDQTGNYYANVSENKIAYSHFTSRGLQLREAEINQFQWTELSTSDVDKQQPFFAVAHAADNILMTASRNFSVTAYKKGTGLFNFHSWRPSYSDPEFTYSLYGNNVLNTFTTELFYRYNQNEQSHGAGINAAYSALFPVLTMGGEYIFNRNVRIRTSPTSVVPGTLDAYELKAGSYIPLNFTAGTSYKFLSFGTNFVRNQQNPTGNTRKIIKSFNSSYLSHFVNWAHQLPRARQQIFPKLGYTLSSGYRHRIDEKDYQVITNAQFYLPSVKNHSLVLAGSFQQESKDNLLFSNRFANSRGYPESDSVRMWRASANYHLPLFYPDWGFGGIVYFQRVRSNLFYDFSKLYAAGDTQISTRLRSTGVELFFDTKWWNQLPVSFGIRYSYLLDAAQAGANKHQWEIIIPTDLLLN